VRRWAVVLLGATLGLVGGYGLEALGSGSDGMRSFPGWLEDGFDFGSWLPMLPPAPTWAIMGVMIAIVIDLLARRKR
jgi:hypothetical protein